MVNSMSPTRTYRMIRQDEKDPLKGMDNLSIKAKRTAKLASLGPVWQRGLKSKTTLDMYNVTEDGSELMKHSHENAEDSLDLKAMKTKAFEES